MAEGILLVEDEEKLARMVELELRYERHEMEKAFDGRAGLDRALLGESDLVLLDIMLPVLFGMEVLRHLQRESAMPVVMLTARDTVMDKVSDLGMGADDYIIKPLAIEELLARIRAALHKRPAQTVEPPWGLLTTGPLTIDIGRREVSVNSEGVELTRREFNLLRYLLENKERVISRESLLDHVWGFDFVEEANAADVYIRSLRTEIDGHFGIKLIHTVRGVGYMIQEGGR